MTASGVRTLVMSVSDALVLIGKRGEQVKPIVGGRLRGCESMGLGKRIKAFFGIELFGLCSHRFIGKLKILENVSDQKHERVKSNVYAQRSQGIRRDIV